MELRPGAGGEAVEFAASDLHGFGPTAVLAPHPDDEALGCGGLIALLCRCGQPVFPVLVSDGGGSHPGSRRFDRKARRAIREAEWREGLACLGVPAERLTCLGWPDGDLPSPGDARFAASVTELQQLLTRLAPRTVVLPWRRDPHADHRATHALVRAALAPPAMGARCLEYPVWLNERAGAGDAPQAGEVRVWRLDVSAVQAAKRTAIACHRSQQGAVFTDDPGGFCLPAALLEQAESPFEVFFEDARANMTTDADLR